MAVTLTSKRYQVKDVGDAIEFCFAQGWTDGLPVVPPTPERVGAMLEAARLAPQQQVVSITAEKVAINAVMAGCKPEYMAVVVAAVEGIGDPAWSYHGPGTSTGGAAVLMIVNGPIARELDINCGDNLFGPGWRANLTIGRALRLVMRNVCGSRPGLLDRGTLGHPGKVSYVIAENEAESPWTPLHVERGFRPEQSTVTVMAAESPHQCYNQLSNTPEGVLTTVADAMRLGGSAGRQPQYAVIIAGEHMRTIAQGDPAVPVRAHPESHRPSQAHQSAARRRPAGRRDEDAPARGVRRGFPRRRGGRAGRPVRGPHPGLGR